MMKLSSVLLLTVFNTASHAFLTLPSLSSIRTHTSTSHENNNNVYSQQLNAQTNDDNDGDNAWDSPEDYLDNPKSSSPSSPSSSSSTPSLGIDIGGQLEPLTAEQAKELKEEATQKINEAFDVRFDEIKNMKRDLQKDFEKSKQNLNYISDLRAKEETTKLMNKIDKISNEFLDSNEELRMGTKMSAKADLANMDGSVGNKNKGLEVGSWGNIGGMDVGMGMGMKNGDAGSGLLGSVGAATAISKNSGISDDDDDDDDDIVEPVYEDRILVICDDKQDANIQKVINKFESLLSKKFDSKIQFENLKPTATIPMGGNSAQCVIISSTSLSNGQSSANNIMSRLLRRTLAPGGGGKVSKPPTHFVIVSPLGTERIDKFPYSMTNMMNGNKLKKAREVEEVIVSTVKGRLVADSSNGGSPSLDYTILKLGDIVEDAKIVNSKKEGEMIISPGDSLDGKVGIDAAAHTLLQSVTLRPMARNTTLSVIGAATANKEEEESIMSEEEWEDWFLRLSGPELWRREGLLDSSIDTDAEVERKFESLAGYVNEWSNLFKNGAKGTGVTTPVNIVRSKLDNDGNNPLAIQSKFGVRLEFKQTNTGSAYKSKSEEREMERPGSPSTSSSSGPVYNRNKKEGGVEAIVELIEDVNGKKDLRVRARRCNMGDFTVVKEMSEESIVKNLGKAVDLWKKL